MKNKFSSTCFYLSNIVLYTCLLTFPLPAALETQKNQTSSSIKNEEWLEINTLEEELIVENPLSNKEQEEVENLKKRINKMEILIQEQAKALEEQRKLIAVLNKKSTGMKDDINTLQNKTDSYDLTLSHPGIKKITKNDFDDLITNLLSQAKEKNRDISIEKCKKIIYNSGKSENNKKFNKYRSSTKLDNREQATFELAQHFHERTKSFVRINKNYSAKACHTIALTMVEKLPQNNDKYKKFTEKMNKYDTDRAIKNNKNLNKNNKVSVSKS